MKAPASKNAAELRRTLGRRRKAARNNLKQYSKLVKSALTPAKSDAPNARPNRTAQEGVHTAAMNVVRELGDWPPLDAGNIHAFRLKVKELRYTLQLDADADPGLVEALGDVQRRIGDWHDWQQLAEIARAILDPEQDGALLTRIDGTAKRKLRSGACRSECPARKVSGNARCAWSLSRIEIAAAQTPPVPGCRTSVRNSARVSFCRKQPTMALVTVDECCFSMPRIIMHRCRASITTPTPCGAIAS